MNDHPTHAASSNGKTANRWQSPRIPRFQGADPIIEVYQLPRPAIQLLTALCEASEGAGLVRTLDENRGIVECWIMPDYIQSYRRLIDEVGRHWPIQSLGGAFE